MSQPTLDHDYEPIKVHVIADSTPSAPAPKVRTTTARTLLLDPAGVVGPLFIQHLPQDDSREYIDVIAVDQPVIVSFDPLSGSVTVSDTVQPSGNLAYLPISSYPYRFYTKRPVWLGSKNAGSAGLVTVIVTRRS